MKNTYAVILAGGSGTRFWPMSCPDKPKQFLSFFGNKKSLFEEAITRIKPLIDPQHIFIVTNNRYKKEVNRQIKSFGIPQTNILFEPQGRNTAPAILWAAFVIQNKDPQALMAVFPSDHLIMEKEKFLKILNRSFELASRNHLVTLGITPTRPETGYGYLKVDPIKGEKEVLEVIEYKEKPDIKTAQAFIKAKIYLWNSGMFIWKTSRILEEFKNYLPKDYALVQKNFTQWRAQKIWPQLTNISIDYGILEKTEELLALLASDIGWSDLGSWEAIFEMSDKDKEGNHFNANVIPLNCKNTLIWSNSRVVAGIDLEDLIIIDTKDSLLICRKNSSQKVREVVSFLK